MASFEKTRDASSTSCGVQNLSLDPSTANHVIGQAIVKEKNPLDNVEGIIERKAQDSWKGIGDQKTWSSLFGRKPSGKSIFPLVTLKACWEKGEFQIFISDPIVDFFVTSMEFTLMGKFMGARLDIETLKKMFKWKWANRREVDIAPMLNGFFSFVFNCKEDMSMVLCRVPWAFSKSTLTIK